MIERFVDVAALRNAAITNAARWDALSTVFDNGGQPDQGEIQSIAQALVDAGIGALSLLITETGKALAAGLPRSTVLPTMVAIRHEFSLLSKCEIHPSLYMHQLAETMATARSAEAPAAACFFLPIVPQLAGDGEGGPEFLAAAQNHINSFNREVLRLLKGDTGAIADVRTSLIAIKNRRPRIPYFTPIALGAAFLSALADGTLPLSVDNKMLFSRIAAVVKAAMNEAPLTDHSVSSRLAYAIVQNQGAQKRVDMLIDRLGLRDLLSSEAPQIAEFPPADIFVAVFTEASDAWNVYTQKGMGRNDLKQKVDMLLLISGNNADLKKLARTFAKLAAAITAKHFDAAQPLFDHVTQFMARYFDAVSSRDPQLVARVAEEEWQSAQEIEQFGFVSSSRIADKSAHADVAVEAAADVRAAAEAVTRTEIARAIGLLETVAIIIRFLGLNQACETAERLLELLRSPTGAVDHKALVDALDYLGRYLDIAYVRGDDANHLLEHIAQLQLASQHKSDDVEMPSDQEMFEIFLEEAKEVVAAIHQICKSKPKLASDNEAQTLRRAFHTLKGSSRMVGMTKLGDLMAQIEGIFDHAMAARQAYPAELTALALEASDFAMALCDEIAAKGQAHFTPGKVTARIAQLRPSA